MKLVTRTQRLIALFIGLAMVIALIARIVHDVGPNNQGDTTNQTSKK